MSKLTTIMLNKAELREAWRCLLLDREIVREMLRKEKNSYSFKKSARLLNSILRKFSEATDE